MNLNRSLLGHPKFHELVMAVEDRHKAIGLLAEVYILAKDHYVPNRYPIPEFELIESGIPIHKLMKLRFIEKEIDGYYLADSQETFESEFLKINQRKQAAQASLSSPKRHKVRGASGRFKKASKGKKKRNARR